MRFTVPNIRTKSPKRSLQEGQAIVLIALLILVLFGMLGLAVDSGRADVDRRDEQTAVVAAALAAGDWYDNYPDYNDLVNTVIPQSVAVYEANLRIYSGLSSSSHTSTTVGVPPNNNLPQDSWHDTFAGGYTLDITATNTQFNGYQFSYTTNHNLPDPGYTATSQAYYGLGGATFNRGGYVEMTPGTYNNWSINGGTCYFLDAGVYTWNGGYTSHGGMTSNELKPPGEVLWSKPRSTNGPTSSFWGGCDGSFNVSVAVVPVGNGLKHNGSGGNWGV